MIIINSPTKPNFETKMKLFQTIQEHYAILGIGREIVLKRVFFGFLIFGCATTSQVMYILRTANDFVAYIEGVCWISGSFIVCVCFLTILFKRALLLESFHNFKKFLDLSEPLSRKFLSTSNAI